MDFKLEIANKNGFLLLAIAFLAHPAFADITINGTSYSGAVNLSGSNYTISGTGTTSNRLIVKESCTITLDNASFPLSTGTTEYMGTPRNHCKYAGLRSGVGFHRAV